MILGAGILSANPGLIFWTIVTFLFLLVLLSWKAWKPILKIIAEREKTIHDALDSARKEREEAEKMRAEQAAAMERFRRENAEQLRKAQGELERARAEKMAEIEKEAAERRAQAAREIDEAVAKARGELKAFVADLVIDAARHLIEHTMDEKKQRALVQEYIANIESQASEKAA